jgi:hypothetical protein
MDAARSERARSSPSDSTLKQRIPASIPAASSGTVFPTPLKTIRSAGIPASSARRSSPADTMSAPAPMAARVRSTPRLPFALTE